MEITALATPIIERAHNGALLLDQHQIDWAGEIDTDLLDLAEFDRCVLGQLFGSFSRGLELLDLVAPDGYHTLGGTAAAYGFTLTLDENTGSYPTDEGVANANWAALRDAWLVEIAART